MKTIILNVINEIKVNKGLETFSEAMISNDSDLRNDLGLDSLDLAVFTVKIEEETGVDVFETGIVTKFGEVLVKLENS